MASWCQVWWRLAVHSGWAQANRLASKPLAAVRLLVLWHFQASALSWTRPFGRAFRVGQCAPKLALSGDGGNQAGEVATLVQVTPPLVGLNYLSECSRSAGRLGRRPTHSKIWFEVGLHFKL